MRIRSGYSFRTAVGHLNDVVKRQKEIGLNVAVLTDRDSTFGFRRFRDACKKNDLKPIYGVEIGTVSKFGEKKPIINYCTFLAKSDIKDINLLVRKSTGSPGKEPSLMLTDALKAEGVIRIIGEKATFDQLRDIQAASDTYLALSPSTPKKLVRTAIELGIPLVATSDNYFTNEEDLEFYRVTLGKRANMQTYPTYILNDLEWHESVKFVVSEDEANAALENRNNILNSLNAKLVSAQLYKPERKNTLLEMCQEGAKKLGVNLEDPIYAARLERELSLIKEKEFEDYFYIIADIVSWAKGRMIVGPARGSSCGSLVCYLIGITTIDPIPYGLLFERFCDIHRKDLPDIDIDFSDKRRDMVFDYMESTYGRDRVARLGTVGFFKSRSALKQTASILRIPDWRCEKFIETIDSHATSVIRSDNELENAINNTEAGKDLVAQYPNVGIAARIEGHPNNACLSGSTEVKIGQTNHLLKGKMTIKDLWEIFINSPSEDTERMLRLHGVQRMPILVSMGTDLRCRQQKAMMIFNNGKKECISLEFEDGSKIECTKDHKFIIDGEWKPCSEARIGSLFCKMLPANSEKKSSSNSDMEWKTNKGNARGSRGEKSNHFKHLRYSIVRDLREKFNGGLCQDCKEKYGEDLHHNDKNHGKINPYDVSWLCKSCHRKRHSGENNRWKNGLPTGQIRLVGVKEIGMLETFDIEMPEHHNFVLGNGIITHNSQHAAGVLVTQDPVINYVAVDERTNAAMVDKKDAEILNLLKIDALGLTQLSVFERTLQLIGVPDKSGWLEKLPLDDKKSFDILNEGKFSGIFQFAGGALQGLTRQVKVDNIEDIIAITALARPGPMESGGASTWAKRRSGGEPVDSLHPMLLELTKDTYGVIVYQEQVMQIAREIGKMDWPDVSDLRKAISKSAGREALEKFWDKFKAGALQNGIEEHVASRIWEMVNTFGSYGFNRSHAVAYGFVSYWCCYLKAHHPIEFCAATLDAETDPLKQIRLLRELHFEGIDYIPFDPNYSSDKWEVAEKDGKKTLIGPLTSVKDIGPSAVIEILGCRKSGTPLRPVLRKRLENAKTEIDSIFPVQDTVNRKFPDLKEDANITTTPIPILSAQCGVEGDVVIIGVLKRMTIKDENEDSVVQRRGYTVRGPTAALNMFLMDDTDEIFAKINRFDYEKFARDIIDRGKTGSAIYALKGNIPKGFRMLSVKNVKFLCYMNEG